jgi:serine/threonine protein kinase
MTVAVLVSNAPDWAYDYFGLAYSLPTRRLLYFSVHKYHKMTSSQIYTVTRHSNYSHPFKLFSMEQLFVEWYAEFGLNSQARIGTGSYGSVYAASDGIWPRVGKVSSMAQAAGHREAHALALSVGESGVGPEVDSNCRIRLVLPDNLGDGGKLRPAIMDTVLRLVALATNKIMPFGAPGGHLVIEMALGEIGSRAGALRDDLPELVNRALVRDESWSLSSADDAQELYLETRAMVALGESLAANHPVNESLKLAVSQVLDISTDFNQSPLYMQRQDSEELISTAVQDAWQLLQSRSNPNQTRDLALYMAVAELAGVLILRSISTVVSLVLMRRMDMDLSRYTRASRSNGSISEPNQRFLNTQVPRLMEQLHGMGVYCYDLKLANTMVDVDDQGQLTDVRLVDFDTTFCCTRFGESTCIARPSGPAQQLQLLGVSDLWLLRQLQLTIMSQSVWTESNREVRLWPEAVAALQPLRQQVIDLLVSGLFDPTDNINGSATMLSYMSDSPYEYWAGMAGTYGSYCPLPAVNVAVYKLLADALVGSTLYRVANTA